jgi:hypothetical protein
VLVVQPRNICTNLDNISIMARALCDAQGTRSGDNPGCPVSGASPEGNASDTMEIDVDVTGVVNDTHNCDI